MSVFAFKNAIFYFWKETHLIWQLGYSILTAMIIRESDQRNKWRWQKRWGDFHTFFLNAPAIVTISINKNGRSVRYMRAPCHVKFLLLLLSDDWNDKTKFGKSLHTKMWRKVIICVADVQIFYSVNDFEIVVKQIMAYDSDLFSLLPDIHDLQCHLVWSLTEKENVL